ncbi:MAG: Nif3-like dinuclear metal center hexameric protein [Lachnospirales bacterium]
MTMYKVKDVIKYMESIAPMEYKEKWDNVGLLIGDANRDVECIVLSLDLTYSAIGTSAFRENAMIITHHPLFFNPLKAITTSTEEGRKAIACIEKHISVYTAHTNFDNCPYGTNDVLFDMLELKDKEVICPINEEKNVGLGRIGVLNKATTLKTFLDTLNNLKFKNIRYFLGEFDLDAKVLKVGLCTGSFDENTVRMAKKMGVDVFLGGDLKYHNAQICWELELPFIDIGHYYSEIPAMEKLKTMLEKEFDIQVMLCDANETKIINYN